MNLNLEGKTAVITGGANGIGAEIALTLATEGANVVVADIDGAAAKSYADCLREKGLKAISATCDVTDPEAVQQMVDKALAEFNSVDILVNNAGFVRDNKITRMPVEDWDSVISANLKGPWLCSKAVIPHMVDREWGRIVNISSRAHWGNPGQSNYSSAKSGVIGLTRSLAMEQGRKNITVNAIAPGFILTDAILKLPHIEKIKSGALEKNTVPRLGSPADVANAVAFLVSDKSGYINGDILHVSGGRYSG